MIEFLCTFAGILGGVAVVAATLRSHAGRKRSPAPIVESELPAEKMQDIADQLRLLTFRVSADVSAHTEAVGNLAEKLQIPSVKEPERLLSAIEELIAANRKMQNQLADARRRIADQSEMIEFTSVQARTDALTGLANRRALDEFLTNCLAAIREGDFAGLLLLDIDHFKKFNDDFGHTTGDAVLTAFARCIKDFCGQTAFAARYGGEEFAIILTGYSMVDIVERAAKLRSKIGQQVITYEDLQLRVTASGGLCELKPGDSPQEAYDRADVGLYRAKENGRNRGYWLHNDEWLPIPEVDLTDKKVVNKQLAPATSTTDESEEDETSEESTKRRQRLVSTLDSAGRMSYRERIEKAIAANAQNRSAEFLDLGTFVERLDNYLIQLRRANLPATAAMIQAVGLEELGSLQARASWKSVLAILQSQMRGIDVACHFKPACACLLMPGCTLDAALERCSKIQNSLEQARESWEPRDSCPTRLAIAIATAQSDEETGSFLQRIEEAMEEAEHVDMFEIIFHDGTSAQVQRLV